MESAGWSQTAWYLLLPLKWPTAWLSWLLWEEGLYQSVKQLELVVSHACITAAHAPICRAMARQSAAAVEQTARLEEEVLQLQQELASRPTPEQYASLQRQVDIMDRHIAKLAAEKAANAKANRSAGHGMHMERCCIRAGS